MKEKIIGITGDVGAKKILELNKDKILNLEINDQSITKSFNTQAILVLYNSVIGIVKWFSFYDGFIFYFFYFNFYIFPI